MTLDSVWFAFLKISTSMIGRCLFAPKFTYQFEGVYFDVHRFVWTRTQTHRCQVQAHTHTHAHVYLYYKYNNINIKVYDTTRLFC